MSPAAAILRWSAWAPGLESESDWRDFAAGRRAADGPADARPDVKFLPAMQRRRCDLLSRMMLAVANGCTDEALRGEVACVFASRHGSFGTTVSMLEDLSHQKPLSPTSFSHSVRNTQAGLFSIWTRNRSAALSLAARRASFEHGFLEALCVLERRPGRPVLLVCGDEKLPEPIEPLRDPARDPDLSHALGLLIGPQPDSSDGSPAVALSLERASSDAPQEGDPLPRALAFLRFLLGPDEELCLRDPPRSWRFRKV